MIQFCSVRSNEQLVELVMLSKKVTVGGYIAIIVNIFNGRKQWPVIIGRLWAEMKRDLVTEMSSLKTEVLKTWKDSISVVTFWKIVYNYILFFLQSLSFISSIKSRGLPGVVVAGCWRP